MKAVVIATVVMSLFWLYWTVGRSINTIEAGMIPMRVGYETLQMTLIASYSVLAVALITVQMMFLVKQLQSIKNGVIFDRMLAKYLIIWGVLWFFYDFAATNVWQMAMNCEFECIVMDGTMVGIPVISVVFAILYKMAAEVSEENNLTI